jgi:hypothetical protein
VGEGGQTRQHLSREDAEHLGAVGAVPLGGRSPVRGVEPDETALGAADQLGPVIPTARQLGRQGEEAAERDEGALRQPATPGGTLQQEPPDQHEGQDRDDQARAKAEEERQAARDAAHDEPESALRREAAPQAPQTQAEEEGTMDDIQRQPAEMNVDG